MAFPNMSIWPVYKMCYRASNVTKSLRVEWNHVPQPQDVEGVMTCLRAYMDKPSDEPNNAGQSFETFLPDYCVVLKNTEQYGSHSNYEEHISVRFAKANDRQGNGWGHTVHIYIFPETHKYDSTKAVFWGDGSQDRPNQRPVWKQRSDWPPGVDAQNAPWYPGEEPLPTVTESEQDPTGPHPGL